ncbi:type I restriction-modification system DNA methylase subunit [Pseudarthrobacter oxydans]|uniref:site-specific DNA-methyltransferase (adenine-specific) n=1 Tax=Pseudarthrobacter oxydans TaxID=1671 RepID=A0AAW8NFF5_PSEOX|nr:Eco57I restriction-modification methylase domain-containing protein [Pseudarthrobacter oxydans]MDR6794721.1 type I restriction-modification system DNA methylase subunit [Pseudarthrobacter oxydans]MDR7166077.1 type I restriction-modification system DNA methylase subunit [Pseudarthrobacter oxydans]
MASLFGKKKLEALAAEITTEEIQDKLEIVRQWHQDYHHGSLKADKETSREQQYNQDFFMKILGYKEKPATPYTFEPKATTLKKQLPDAVISFTDTAAEIENISAVIELKGASIELDKPQRRDGNMSPVQQAFKYKSQYRSCPFVIVSNFYEFRLYNDHQLDFEVWTLDDLVNPAYDYRAFKTFYGLLRRDRLTVAVGKSPTELLLSEFRVEQDAIGKEFYGKYKDARLELLRDIYRRNEDLRSNFDLAIQKGQKLIDRLVFTFFAEDKGLLPENILLGVQKDAATSSVASLWDMLKTLFAGIDAGSDKLGIPVGYNGGLFAYDAELNAMSISDDVLTSVLALGGYDFDEDLSVNILGHIFEQSISDLEEIRRKVDDKHIPDALDDLRAKSNKRKSDGVFYTPDYIVRYIVDSTLGTYLRSIEEKLMVKYQLASKRKDATYEAAEANMYREYQLALQTVHVIDPACGSGAFLVYALDFLLAENKRVAAILEANSSIDDFTASVFSDESIIDLVLRQNLFGVDINDESVEITKLSLWLKTARPGQKLTALDANIKCGNSLIDGELVDPKKAFNYRQQFKKPFEGGGFNVVVGNPPYVSAMEMSRSMPDSQRTYLKKNYDTSVGAVDLYIYFFELGIKLLRPGGALGFITPNRYLSASYGAKLREWLISNVHFRTLIDYSDKNVFEDASTYPVITILDKVKPGEDEVYEVEAGRIDEDTRQPVVDQYSSELLTKLTENILGFLLNDGIDIAAKVFDKGVPLANAGKINATSTAGEADLYSAHINSDGQGLKIINTGTIDPYVSMWGLKRFKDKGVDYMQPYLDIHHKDVSVARRDLYKSNKIIIAKIGLLCEAYYDANGEYASINTNCVHSFTKDFPAEYVQAWLSSSLYNYVFETLFDGLRMSGGYLLYSSPNLRNTPIPKAPEADRLEIVGWAKTVIQKRQEQAALEDKFKRFVLNEAGLSAWPRKLNRWWEVDFFDFVKGLKYQGSLKEKESLSEYFDEYKATVADHIMHIDNAARRIDKRFYELNELTEAEIAKVEAAKVTW